MTKKQLMASALIVAASAFASAQAPVQTPAQAEDVRHVTRRFELATTSVRITAEAADVNFTKGRMDLYGVVTMRPSYRPQTTEVAVTNGAGIRFPTFPPIVLHFQGSFQITVDHLAIGADEADVNTRTGEIELHGNVFVLTPVAAR